MPTVIERGCDPSYFLREPGKVTLDPNHRPITYSSVNVEAVCCWLRQPAQAALVYIVLTPPGKEGCVAILRRAWVEKFEYSNGLSILTDFEPVPFGKGFGVREGTIWGYEVICREQDFLLWFTYTDTAKAKLIASLDAAKAYDSASVELMGMVTG